jgi:riboflavin kinase / FMN adenylyltransferase
MGQPAPLPEPAAPAEKKKPPVMQVTHDAYRGADLPRGGVATIGNFDGIHRGQRAIIERVVERAAALGRPGLVLTFEPHPLAVLRPGEPPPARLTTPGERRRLLEEAGVEHLLVIRFDEELSATPAEEFVRKFLAGKLAIAELHVGPGFTFGFRREGDLDLLGRLGGELGFVAGTVPEVTCRSERISSTRIRRAIAEGRVEDANEMLGRAYSLSGTVARGDRMGVRLGWPTINLTLESELIPADGVYAGRVFFPAFPATFVCATNIGTRPTVYENYQRVVESHILDFATDVYGERVEVRFHKRLREERLFPTVMDLSAQIARDVEATREYFAARRHLEELATPGDG